MIIGFDGYSAVYENKRSRNYSRLVLDALSMYCEDNKYFVYSPSLIDNPYLTPIMTRAGVYVKIQRTGITSFMWRSVWGVIRNIKRHHVQVYHGLCGQLPLRLKEKHAAAVVTFEKTKFLNTRGIKSSWKKYMGKKACAKAGAVIVLSEMAKQQIMDNYNVPEQLIHVIPPACSNSFADNLNPAHLRGAAAKYKMPKDYIIIMGRIDNTSHAKQVLMAMKQCAPHMHLVLTGNAERKYLNDINRLSHAIGMGGKIIYLPTVRTAFLPALMANSKMCVASTTGNSFPYSVIYSQCALAPLIATQQIADVTGDGAIITDLDDIDAIVKSIDTILNDKAKRNELIEAERANSKRFELKKLAMAHQQIYQDVLTELCKKQILSDRGLY